MRKYLKDYDADCVCENTLNLKDTIFYIKFYIRYVFHYNSDYIHKSLSTIVCDYEIKTITKNGLSNHVYYGNEIWNMAYINEIDQMNSFKQSLHNTLPKSLLKTKKHIKKYLDFMKKEWVIMHGV